MGTIPHHPNRWPWHNRKRQPGRSSKHQRLLCRCRRRGWRRRQREPHCDRRVGNLHYINNPAVIDSSGKRTAVIFLSCYWLLAVSYPPAMPAAVDYLQPKRLTGSIYDKPGGRLLFTFRRTATQTGDAVRVVREFLSPDGSLAAQERVLYQGG